MKNSVNQVAEIKVSYNPSISHKPVIKSSYDCYVQFSEFFSQDTISLQEQFMVMYLNRSSRILGIYPLSIGGITGSVADVRLIISVALKVVASSIVICHNHPSGNLTPSSCDLQITKKIKEACLLVDLRLLDHIIVAPDNKYLSFSDDGLL